MDADWWPEDLPWVHVAYGKKSLQQYTDERAGVDVGAAVGLDSAPVRPETAGSAGSHQRGCRVPKTVRLLPVAGARRT